MSRILIIDDHPIFRRGLAMALEEAGDLTVCGEGASCADALDLTRSLRPDVVLLDLSMPGGGQVALEGILAHDPAMRVVILTASAEREDVLRALQAGAKGYVLKGVGGRTLTDALREVARGEGYVEPVLAARLLTEARVEATAPEPQTASVLAQLTPREGQVLVMVAAGHSNKEIARQGNMQEKTVKHHMTRILQKLNVRNRTEAALKLRGRQHGGG